MRSILPFVVAFALPACNIIEREGRQQTTTFTTFPTRQEVRARTESWLAERGLYQVTQIDVQSVTMETVAEGTRVEAQTLTFLVGAGGGRERADQLSPEAGTDHVAVVQVLMPRPF